MSFILHTLPTFIVSKESVVKYSKNLLRACHIKDIEDG